MLVSFESYQFLHISKLVILRRHSRLRAQTLKTYLKNLNVIHQKFVTAIYRLVRSPPTPGHRCRSIKKKITMKEQQLSEKHPSEDTTRSFNDRISAIANDRSLSEDQRLAALIAMSEPNWVSTHKPPLFTAALSLDMTASAKAVAVEAALRTGDVDPNELDHDLNKMRRRGRALAFFVDADLHYEVNGGVDGMVTNLPAIEVMLRHGADPRLGAPFLGPKSALRCVRVGQGQECAPGFYEAAWRMLDEAAEALEGELEAEERSQYREGNGKLTKFWGREGSQVEW